ncbi:MAG: glycosyltransferase family 4 protein [Leptolyngbyaceae bacterium]|nr:glycosyltransferase family 4 protein [Leptolyngbyaceae bacterium]
MTPSNSPLKISFIVSDLSGGGAVRAFLLGQVCKALGYRVEVVGFQSGPELYAIPPDNMAVVSLPGAIYPQFIAATRQLLAKLDGDILYAVKPKPSSFGVGLLKKWQTGRPLFLDMDDWEMSWHGGDEWRYRPPSLKQVYRDIFKSNGQLRQPDHPLYVKWLESMVAKADALTVDTSFLQNRFGGVYVPNGKDTDLFDPTGYDGDRSRQKYGLSAYRVLMFPGAPRPHKGVEDVLMALEKLNQPDLRLVIVGGSPYDDYDETLMAQWGHWIVKLPRCPVEQMPEILAAAHVMVVPQRDTLTAQAQFPLKLTDGMAMGKPVLSTRVGDIPDILADSGYLVDPESPDQLAAAIAHIFAHFDEATHRGQQGRIKCINHYSVTTMAQTLAQLLAVYDPCMAAPSLASPHLSP